MLTQNKLGSDEIPEKGDFVISLFIYLNYNQTKWLFGYHF